MKTKLDNKDKAEKKEIKLQNKIKIKHLETPVTQCLKFIARGYTQSLVCNTHLSLKGKKKLFSIVFYIVLCFHFEIADDIEFNFEVTCLRFG